MRKDITSLLTIREEGVGDYAAIRKLNHLAFGNNDGESQLVDQLRNDGKIVASLVAIYKEQIVGHILFSTLPIETNQKTIDAVALAPMAVLPELQRHGVGSTLVDAGLMVCKQKGKLAVFVVGHKEYYPRFGFSKELAKSVNSPYSHYVDAWMAKELQSGVLTNIMGIAHYPEAFTLVN